jgi:hypothetical protein
LSLQAGCAEEDNEDRVVQAVSQPSPDWIHPACSSDALQPPPANGNDACNGPWSFGYVDNATDARLCGEDTTRACVTYNACTSWDLNSPGDGLGVVQTSGQTGRSGNFTSTCGTDGSGDCDTTSICAGQARTFRSSNLPAGTPLWAANAFTTRGITIVDSTTPKTINHVTIQTTKYGCAVSFTNAPGMMTTARPACGCAHFPAKTCARDSGTIVTAPGQTKPTSPGAPIAAGDTRAFTNGPTCLTCDQIPVDTDANIQAKFNCLNNGLSTATNDLKSSLAGRVKLMLQLYGDRLTAAQRASAETVYNADPDAAAFCSVPVAWDASCSPDASAVHLTSQLQLCSDLVNDPAASTGAAGAELASCFAQLKILGGLNNTCRLAMRDAADNIVQSVLEKGQPSFAGDFATLLPLAMSRIAAWWQAASVLAGTDRTWFSGEASALERWLWSTIEAQRMPLPNQPPEDDAGAATMLADISDTRLTDDLAVLSFAYAPGQSVSAPPLLTITSDALQAISDRLQRLEPIHDVGCRFGPCLDGSTLKTTAISELIHALAVLPNATAFQSAVAAATQLRTQKPDIYSALVQIRDQHLYLDTAWNLYGRSEPFSSLAAVSDPPIEAAGLAAIVRSASQAWASYQATGEFLPWNRPRLTASTLEQAALVIDINGYASITDTDKTTYMTNRLNVIRDLLDQSNSGKAEQSQADQIDQQVTHLKNVAQRMDGLESRELTERAAFSDFQSEFDALSTSGAVDPTMQYRVDTIPVFTASATDSHYPNDGQRNVVRDNFHTETLTKGQTLRAHITGQWSPTCAITNGNLLDSNTGLLFPTVIGESETGPEGYFVTASLSGFSSGSVSVAGEGVTEHTTLTCATSALNFGLCSQANNPPDGDGFSGGASIGSEVRSSATFNTGLRLATTPYPEAPVGSLIAVITRKGVTGGPLDPPVLDIRVVDRDDVIAATTPPHLDGWPDDGQTEIHFVVNDRTTNPDGSPCARPDTASLTIELSISTPLGAVAVPIGVAMSDALGAIEAQAASVIAEGALATTEADALRTTAWKDVEDGVQRQGIGLAGLPPELRQMFDSYVERELASIDRRAQHNALRQEYAQVALQIDALQRQQALSANQDRLLHLIPRWRLQDLSGYKLSGSAALLAERLTSYAAPIFELRDPASSTIFAQQVSTQTSALTSNLDITAPYENAVDGLVQFARATAGAIGDAQFALPSTQRRTIIIAIPRPSGTGHGPWNGPWQTVSAATAKAFWDSAVDAKSNPLPDATFTLSPADIYSPAGGPSSLNCGDLAPVVRHVGFYFATDGQPAVLNAANINIRTTAAITSPVVFPLLGHMMALEWGDPLGIAMDVRVLNGDTASVLVDANGNPANFGVWPTDLDAGAGISPFTSFRLNMQAFTPGATDAFNVLGEATAMFAVFDVERRTANQDVWLPGVCASN